MLASTAVTLVTVALLAPYFITPAAQGDVRLKDTQQPEVVIESWSWPDASSAAAAPVSALPPLVTPPSSSAAAAPASALPALVTPPSTPPEALSAASAPVTPPQALPAASAPVTPPSAFSAPSPPVSAATPPAQTWTAAQWRDWQCWAGWVDYSWATSWHAESWQGWSWHRR